MSSLFTTERSLRSTSFSIPNLHKGRGTTAARVFPLCEGPFSRSVSGVKRTSLFAAHVSASDPKRTFTKIGLGAFGVRYHETRDFFRIMGALRCKANNFFGYDFN